MAATEQSQVIRHFREHVNELSETWYEGDERQAFSEVGWEKWTPKSDKLERRRCQDEEGPARKV